MQCRPPLLIYRVVTDVLLVAFLLFPTVSFAWTQTDRCELAQETPDGKVAVAPTASGILVFLPTGLVADGTEAEIGIDDQSWTERVVGGAIELRGGAEPFLKKKRMTVQVDGEQMLGCDLSGSAAAWKMLQDCEPAVETGGWVILSGEITASTDDRIIGAIRRQHPRGLLLSSVGGLEEEAQRIGYAVREAGLATKVQSDGQCLSECTYIFAAGTSRTVETGGRVGIPSSLMTKGLGVLFVDPGPVTESALYFSEMGVKATKLAVLASSAKTNDIRVFSLAELQELDLVGIPVPEATTSSIAGLGPDTRGNH